MRVYDGFCWKAYIFFTILSKAHDFLIFIIYLFKSEYKDNRICMVVSMKQIKQIILYI